MTNIFVSRQPILNAKQLVEGYELLYPHAGADETLATARVALDALGEIGLERLVGRSRAWINVTAEFLSRDLVLNLPPDRVVLEIAAGLLCDPALLALAGDLRNAGYTIAADDFSLAGPLEPVVAAVDIVKLNMLALGAREVARHAFQLRNSGLTLVAKNIDNGDDFKLAHAAGADLFQGFFFCRPHMLTGRRITPSRIALLQLTSTIQDPTVQLADLERVISGDVALSYRLLKYINSAYFGLRSQVGSIKQALALLGLESLRRWATLTIFADVGDKPRELYVTALIRARFCELAGEPTDGSPAQLFTLGLFSVLDALTETPMRTALRDLPLTSSMRDALIEHRGAGRLLDCVSSIEAGNFSCAEEILPDCSDAYLEAVAWSNDTAGQSLLV
jgi:EAL and modified HD-GYP domain-containing signal transduction protein